MTGWRAVKLWTPKSEERASGYEDAAAYRCARGRFAVSDGVTQSIYAGLWARLLTRCFVRGRHPPGAQLGDILEPARPRWQEHANARMAGLPWYAQIKALPGRACHVPRPDSSWTGRGGRQRDLAGDGCGRLVPLPRARRCHPDRHSRSPMRSSSTAFLPSLAPMRPG